MGSLLEQLTQYLKDILVAGIMNNLTSTFNNLNSKLVEVTDTLATTPADFQPSVFNMIRDISENVMMPVAGIILTFVAVYELIQLVISHNNLANFETWIFFKWIMKTFIAVELVTHVFDITMAIFDVAQYVIEESGGLIGDSTAIDGSALEAMRSTLEAMELGPLFAIFLQTFIVQFIFNLMAMVIYVIVVGRMIEIYLRVSMAPIPFATFGNREQSMIGQNYLRSLIAIGFQGFLIMICIAIYAVLIHDVAFSSDIMGSLWNVLGMTILLGFMLFKTGSVAQSIMQAH